MSTETKSTIAAKLVLAMGEIDAVTKEGKNEMQKYKYVRAADVANEVRKVLVKHRIAFTYSTGAHERWVVDRIDRNTGSVIGQMNYSNLEVHFTFTDADSGDSITLDGIGSGSDTGEKAVYKAMTGALKYALRMNFIIPDESDPENDKAEVMAEVERQKGSPALTQAFTASVAQETPKQAAQKRAAAIRSETAEQQGIFSVDGDNLHCIIKGVQPAKEGGKFCTVTVNGRLPNGGNFANCFDRKLWEPLEMCVGKEVKLKLTIKGQYINVIDLVWCEGQGVEDGTNISPFEDLPPADAYSQ